MIIIEMQENDIIREYNFPEERRNTVVEFFDYLVAEGEILSWSEMPR
jgi:hypothetical protein